MNFLRKSTFLADKTVKIMIVKTNKLHDYHANANVVFLPIDI